MQLSVVFPSVLYREGPQGVTNFIQGIEQIGFDELDMFDHVVMGYPTATRRKPFYSPQMPIMEAFTTLSYAAALTSTLKLGTGVLVLPQRQIALAAKQIATLDILSGGRMRIGVGIGWQRSEYEALGEDYDTRSRRLDEAVALLRAYWTDEHVNYSGRFYAADEIAMEPKPPQGGALPIWIGGTKTKALQRVAEIGDGWMAMNAPGDEPLEKRIATIYAHAENLGRDPATIGMQMALSPGPLDKEARKRFYADPQMLAQRAEELANLSFDHLSIDCVPLFQLGFRTSDALLERLGLIYEQLKSVKAQSRRSIGD